MPNLILFGGTFDPVHYGHINTAIAVQKRFHFERFIFLPCKIPVLKQAALASPDQRVQMLHLALADYPLYPFEVDIREIKRSTPSYMVTTLEEYRLQEGEKTSITLLMGIDAFVNLPQWYEWERLVFLANILIIERPVSATTLSLPLRALLQRHETLIAEDPSKKAHGCIYRFNAGLYECTSSSIRELRRENQEAALPVPLAVAHYIKEKHLYL